MSLKKAEKPQDVLYIKVASINTESQKTPAECRLYTTLILLDLLGNKSKVQIRFYSSIHF